MQQYFLFQRPANHPPSPGARSARAHAPSSVTRRYGLSKSTIPTGTSTDNAALSKGGLLHKEVAGRDVSGSGWGSRKTYQAQCMDQEKIPCVCQRRTSIRPWSAATCPLSLTGADRACRCGVQGGASRCRFCRRSLTAGPRLSCGMT